MRPNPFFVPSSIIPRWPCGWYWYDEEGASRGPYASERLALKALLNYDARSRPAPSLWGRFKAFWL